MRTNQLRKMLNEELRQQAAKRWLLSGEECRVALERGGSDLLIPLGDRLVLCESSREPGLLGREVVL